MDLNFYLIGGLLSILLPLSFTAFIRKNKLSLNENISTSAAKDRKIRLQIEYPMYLVSFLLLIFGYTAITNFVLAYNLIITVLLIVAVVLFSATAYSIRGNGKVFHTYISRVMVGLFFILFFLLSLNVYYVNSSLGLILSILLIIIGLLVVIFLYKNDFKVNYLIQLTIIYGFSFWIFLFTFLS